MQILSKIDLESYRLNYTISNGIVSIVILRRDNLKYTVILDECDLPKLLGFSIGLQVHGNSFCARLNKGYINCKRVYFTLHRYILGVTDPEVLVDHINGNPLDNRRCNLRLTDHTGNAQNRVVMSTNKLGIKGISTANNGAFIARATVNGKTKYLGLFSKLEDAEIAVKEFRSKHMPFSQEALNENSVRPRYDIK